MSYLFSDENNNLAKYNYSYPDSFGGLTFTQIINDFISNNYKYAICYYWDGAVQPSDTVSSIANTNISAVYEFTRLDNKVLIKIITSNYTYFKFTNIDLVTIYINWTRTPNTPV